MAGVVVMPRSCLGRSRRNQPRDGDLREESGCTAVCTQREHGRLTGRRRRGSGRRTPARRGTAAGWRRSRRRRCRATRSRRSGRSGRRALGRSSRPSRCASSCRDPNEPDTWIATAASGRSIEKFATLLTTSRLDLAGPERLEEPLPLLDGGVALDDRGVEVGADLVELVEVLPDHQRRLAGVLARRAARRPGSWPACRRRAGSAPRARRWRTPAARASLQRDPDLDAVGRRDPALRLDVLPRRVVALRARSARTRRPRGRPRGPASRSARSGGGPAGRRSSGRSAPAAGAPRRRRSGPSRGRRAARGGSRRPSGASSSPGTSRW